MKKTVKFSLGFKFSIVIMLMSLLIGALIVLVSYQLYTQQISDRYAEQGAALANSAATIVNWDKIDYYLETLDEDEEYQETLENLRLCATAGNTAYLFVLVPSETGCTYVYDTDSSEDRLPLGTYLDWSDSFADQATALSQGQRIDPVVSNEEYGWLMSVYIPFNNSEGEFVGYLGVDYSAEHLVDEEWSFIGQLIAVTLIVALTMTAIFLVILRFLVLKPVSSIATAANNYLDDKDEEAAESNSITQLRIRTHDELQSLSESLQSMEEKIQNYIEHLEKATYKAETDSMTGILNREAFERRVEQVLNAGGFEGYFVFMMIDLDNFKSINDTYGHGVGDEAIIKCGQAIQSKFRQSDFVARVGGDEFAVFYKSPASLNEVEERAAAICDAVHKISFENGMKLSISVGIIVHKGDTTHTYQELYIEADNVLYDAKESGRDCYLVRQGHE